MNVLSSSTMPWLMQALCEHYVSNQNLSLFVRHVLDAPNLFVDAGHDKELIMAFVIDGSLPTEEVPPKEVLARLVERAKHKAAGISWHHQLKPLPLKPPLRPPENFGYNDIVEAGKQAAVAQAPKIQLHVLMIIAACFYVLSRRGFAADSEITIWAFLDAYMHIWNEMDQAQQMDSWLSPTFVGPDQ